MEANLEHALQSALSFLEAHNYAYAIIGGIALAQWGLPRLTQDVDIKVLVPNMDYSTVRSNIEAAFPESAWAQTTSLDSSSERIRCDCRFFIGAAGL